MRILKPSWAHERTRDYFDPSAPREESLLPAFKGRRDLVTRTVRGLGSGTKLIPVDPSSRAEQRWTALIKQGLVDLDVVPVLLRCREEGGYAGCDEVELHVVTRVESGATIRALIGGGAYPADDVMRAMARLSFRELLQLI
jgi:hypothetical protein